MITGTGDKRIIGKTSIAGPLTNIIFCSVFFALTFVDLEFIFVVSVLTAAFNAFIAVMNLIPFGILDGWKIFEWNKLVWIAAFAYSVALLIAILAQYHYFFGL